MGCNCGKSKKFEHVAKDGTVTVVSSQLEAISLARKVGGTWRIGATK